MNKHFCCVQETSCRVVDTQSEAVMVDQDRRQNHALRKSVDAALENLNTAGVAATATYFVSQQLSLNTVQRLLLTRRNGRRKLGLKS